MIRLPIGQDAAADIIPIFREGLKQSRLIAGEKAVIYADTFTNPSYSAAFLAAARDLGAEAFIMTQPLINADASQRAWPRQALGADDRGDEAGRFRHRCHDRRHALFERADAILATGTRILRVREPDDCLLRLLPSEEVKDAREPRRRALQEGQASCASLPKTAPTSSWTRATAGFQPIRHGRRARPLGPLADRAWSAPRRSRSRSRALLVLSPGEHPLPVRALCHGADRLPSRRARSISIEGGREAIMLNEYLERRGDRNCRRLAHIGWGVEHRGAGTRFPAAAGTMAAASRRARSTAACSWRSARTAISAARMRSRLHIDIALRNKRLELDGDADRR